MSQESSDIFLQPTQTQSKWERDLELNNNPRQRNYWAYIGLIFLAFLAGGGVALWLIDQHLNSLQSRSTSLVAQVEIANIQDQFLLYHLWYYGLFGTMLFVLLSVWIWCNLKRQLHKIHDR